MNVIPDITRLKQTRRALGLSQHELAKRAGVSQSLIAKIESGNMDPSLSNAQRIAKALAEEAPKEATVGQVMSRNVLSFAPETPVLEAVKTMKKKGISQIPVIKENVVVGRVTESCILDNVEKIDTATLEDIMMPPSPMVDKETVVSAVLPLLQAYNAVLVLKNGLVVGIVTKADVMGAALQHKL